MDFGWMQTPERQSGDPTADEASSQRLRKAEERLARAGVTGIRFAMSSGWSQSKAKLYEDVAEALEAVLKNMGGTK